MGGILLFAEVYTLLHIGWISLLPVMLFYDGDHVFFALSLLNCLVGMLVGARLQSLRQGLLISGLMSALGIYLHVVPFSVTDFPGARVEEVAKIVFFIASTYLGMALGLLLPKGWQLTQVYQHPLQVKVLKWALAYTVVFLLINQLPSSAWWQASLVFASFLIFSYLLMKGLEQHVIRGVLMYVALVFCFLQGGEVVLGLVAKLTGG